MIPCSGFREVQNVDTDAGRNLLARVTCNLVFINFNWIGYSNDFLKEKSNKQKSQKYLKDCTSWMEFNSLNFHSKIVTVKYHF